MKRKHKPLILFTTLALIGGLAVYFLSSGAAANDPAMHPEAAGTEADGPPPPSPASNKAMIRRLELQVAELEILVEDLAQRLPAPSPATSAPTP